MAPVDITTLPLDQLLALRAAINREIQRRGHTRTATSLEGELMERVVADAYGGTLAPTTTKSYDVSLPDGQTIQVKVRSLPRGTTRFWEFDDFQFDFAVVVSVERDTGHIVFAREIASEEVAAKVTAHANGSFRLPMGRGKTAGKDVTQDLRESYSALA